MPANQFDPLYAAEMARYRAAQMGLPQETYSPQMSMADDVTNQQSIANPMQQAAPQQPPMAMPMVQSNMPQHMLGEVSRGGGILQGNVSGQFQPAFTMQGGMQRGSLDGLGQRARGILDMIGQYI